MTVGTKSAKRSALGVALIGASLLAAGSAHAQTVEGVIVEGTRGNALKGNTGLSVLPTTIQDTPQAVNVVTGELISSQKVTTLDGALKNVPGITIAIGEGGQINGDSFRIRGQDASNDVYTDGLRDFGAYTRDAFTYQEVQVLQGPSGALFGRGAVGGVINTVSKQPVLRDRASVEATAGSGAPMYRLTGDFNKQLGDSSAVRVNAFGQANRVVDRDYIYSKRWGVAASLGLGLGADTTFIASYVHQQDKRRPDYGIIIVQPPGSLIAKPASEFDVGVERSSFLGLFNDIDRNKSDLVTTRLSHKANDWLTLTSDTRVGVYSRYFQYSTLDNCNAPCPANLFDGNPATKANGGYGGGGPYDLDAWSAQNISTARIDSNFGGMKNMLLVGIDTSFQSNKRKFYAYTLPTGITVRNTMPHDIVDPDPRFPAGYSVFFPSPTNNGCPYSTACTTPANTYVTNNDTQATSLGAFITDQLHFTDQWSVIGSVRVDNYHAEFTATTMAGVATKLSSNSVLTNPRASLVFEPNDKQTYYVSYGKSATPPGSSIIGTGTVLAATTKDLDPEESQTYEAGAKVNFFGDKLGVTASVYKVKKDNAKQTDPATGFIQAQSGQRQEINGYAIGVTGKVTKDWTVYGGYAFTDSEITQDYSCGTTAPIVCNLNKYTIGRDVTFNPKNAASFWTTYSLDSVLKGLSIGGGANWVDEIPVGYTIAGTAPNPTGLSRISMIPESVNYDAVISYEVNGYRVQLNGQNLSDRTNYTQIFGNRGVPAPGRTVLLSLAKAF
jgi:catecholate siderophore receptor